MICRFCILTNVNEYCFYVSNDAGKRVYRWNISKNRNDITNISNVENISNLSFFPNCIHFPLIPNQERVQSIMPTIRKRICNEVPYEVIYDNRYHRSGHGKAHDTWGLQGNILSE